MSKIKTSYNCTSCNYQSVKWIGCCPSCNQWNTFEQAQQAVSVTTPSLSKSTAQPAPVTTLDNVKKKSPMRMKSGMQEWDRVTGGGIMPGSFIVLTGDPGIGKSTLLLQICYTLAHDQSVLYFSSEESLEQVKLRAERLNTFHENVHISDQSDLEIIMATVLHHKPSIVVIDSIQNCHLRNSQALPGSTGQLREAAFHLMRLAKEHNIAIILTGHITKEGTIAGPKTLEHMVDAVFYLQGEGQWQTRILRAVKNRFGTINELGFFEMQEEGLQEVHNINAQLIEHASNAPGAVFISTVEGTRPLLLEMQALTIPSKFGVPQRVVTGVDHKRVVLIAAILEKYLQVKLSSQDIFFKVGGGFKVTESGADLGIALALLSSYFQQPLPEHALALAEISLTGKLKVVNNMKHYVQEAHQLGLKNLLTADSTLVTSTLKNAQCFKNVYELLRLFPTD